MIRLLRTMILVLGLITLHTSLTYAFDGNRKGFILGGGVGWVPVAHWSADADFYGIGFGTHEESRLGYGLQFVTGGAFNEREALLFEVNIAAFSSNLAHETIYQAFMGAVWYHYFGEVGNSFFTAAGLGFYTFQVGTYDATDPGGAVITGGGYEFAPHWQAGLYLSFGQSTDDIRSFHIHGNFEHANLSLLVSGFVF